jgi:methylenetetrahydrofolate reductase (NADPH)
MPVFSPRSFQPPYFPYHRDSFPVRVFTAFERAAKGALFGCRMCGNCILQETAFVCPMTCPKGMRNGPCGGSTPAHCYVDPTRPCTWYLIYQRAERMGRTATLLEIQAPLDGRRTGHETWLDLLQAWRGSGTRLAPPAGREALRSRVAHMFHTVRQPGWWQGDDQYHPPTYSEPISNLERSLRSGAFTVTAEIAPPLSAEPAPMVRKVLALRDWVTAANFTDNASAVPRMSSQASSVFSRQNGLEPVMQLQARDRNRFALQSEALGASALGIRNILCLSGDHLRLGPGPTPASNQNDMDAVQVLWILRRMRDEGVYLDGRELKNRPSFFLGAAASPYAALPRFEAIRAEKKISAGAQFIQTQPILDYERFLEWLEAIDRRGLLGKVHILAGVIPLKSAKAAHFMADEVPGVVVPPPVLQRMDQAADQKEEGVAIALELIEKLKHTPGVSGLHIMAVHWEEIVPRLIKEAGIPQPVRADDVAAQAAASAATDTGPVTAATPASQAGVPAPMKG